MVNESFVCNFCTYHGNSSISNSEKRIFCCLFSQGRSVYRVVEFAGDSASYLQTTEWPFYIFDSVFIFISMIIFNIVYPPKYLLGDSTNSNTKSSIGQENRINGNAPVITTT